MQLSTPVSVTFRENCLQGRALPALIIADVEHLYYMLTCSSCTTLPQLAQSCSQGSCRQKGSARYLLTWQNLVQRFKRALQMGIVVQHTLGVYSYGCLSLLHVSAQCVIVLCTCNVKGVNTFFCYQNKHLFATTIST